MPRGILRREDSRLKDEEIVKILQEAEVGYLGTVSPDGEPYIVPLDFVFHAGKIYSHCASEGHKLDNIRANPAVCFSVVGEHRTIPEKTTTAYKSVIAFGKAAIITSYPEKIAAVNLIMEKYAPGRDCTFNADSPLNRRVVVIEIAVEQMTGKQNGQ